MPVYSRARSPRNLRRSALDAQQTYQDIVEAIDRHPPGLEPLTDPVAGDVVVGGEVAVQPLARRISRCGPTIFRGIVACAITLVARSHSAVGSGRSAPAAAGAGSREVLCAKRICADMTMIPTVIALSATLKVYQ